MAKTWYWQLEQEFLTQFPQHISCIGQNVPSIMLRYIPSIPSLLRVFIINRCWILSSVFSASIEMMIWFLSFVLLTWCIMLIDLQMLNHLCIPRINPTWSRCMTLLIYCWIQFANILLKIFASVFIRDIGLEFSFLVVSLSGFGIRVMLAS